jgi:hypothetical protein
MQGYAQGFEVFTYNIDLHLCTILHKPYSIIL